jgi:hypothetical protein
MAVLFTYFDGAWVRTLRKNQGFPFITNMLKKQLDGQDKDVENNDVVVVWVYLLKCHEK